MGADNGKTGKEERKARLAAALRANLRRRKAQARTRRDGESEETEPEDSKDTAR